MPNDDDPSAFSQAAPPPSALGQTGENNNNANPNSAAADVSGASTSALTSNEVEMQSVRPPQPLHVVAPSCAVAPPATDDAAGDRDFAQPVEKEEPNQQNGAAAGAEGNEAEAPPPPPLQHHIHSLDDEQKKEEDEAYVIGWNAPYHTAFCGCLTDPMLSLDVCCFFSCHGAKQLAALQDTPELEDMQHLVRQRMNRVPQDNNNSTAANNGGNPNDSAAGKKTAADMPPPSAPFPPAPDNGPASEQQSPQQQQGEYKQNKNDGGDAALQPKPLRSSYRTEMWMYVFACLCCGPASIRIRRSLRSLYGKDESSCEICMKGCCCPYCSLCQTYRELHAQGLDLHGQIVCPVFAEPRPVMW